ncbi:MAG: DUF4347 domain-containing protein, partial [Planctomycetota bacterium]
MRQHDSSRKRYKHHFAIEALDERLVLDSTGLTPPGIESPWNSHELDVHARNEVIFVDMGIEDADHIIRSLQQQGTSSTRQIFPIHMDRDGIVQIANALDSISNIDAVHIVSHGNDSLLQLGNQSIGFAQLQSNYDNELSIIGKSLSADGDIFLYGCDLASSAEGRRFVETLSQKTGADVAASDDVTTASASGDLHLEYEVGSVHQTEFVSDVLESELAGSLIIEFATGTDSNGDREVFLRGNFIELGLRDQGTFGTESAPPAGWHPRTNNSTDLGFVANPQMNNWATYDGDFFAPGSPVESFSIEINGTTGPSLLNNTAGDSEQNPGSLGLPFATPILCGDDAVSVVWNGTSHGVLDVERTYTVTQDGLFILMETTMTNTSASTLTEVYFGHNVDPDNDITIGAGYATQNTIVSQPNASTNIAEVTATQTANDGSFIAMVAEDSRARVSRGGFNNTDASNIWNAAGGLIGTVGSSAFADQAISLAFRFDSIAPGESVDFKYLYILSNGVPLTDALNCLHSPVLDLDADNSSGALDADYKGFYVAESMTPVPVMDLDVDITDEDNSQIQEATIVLTNPQAGDVLTAPTSDAGWPAAVSLDGASTSSNIILTGDATMAEYEAALQLVTFENTLANASTVDRIIEVGVTDVDDHPSNVATSTICVVDLDATKAQTGTPVRNATNSDHWDVDFQVTIENTGGAAVSGIDLIENLAASGNFGNAFVSADSISAADLTFSGTGTAPTINTSWNGSTITNML